MVNEIALLAKGFAGMSMVFAEEEKELDFMISGYSEFELFGQTLHITTTHIATLLVSSLIIIFAIFANRAIKRANEEEAPKGLHNVIEFLVQAADNLTTGNMGVKYGAGFANYIGTLLLFIFFANTAGLFGLRPPTGDYGTTLALALITFTLVQINGFKFHGWGNLTELFKPTPLLFPINLIGEFATPLSMSLRLFGSITAGTIMMGLYYGLLPTIVKIAIPSALHLYLDLFTGAIQAFVFSMLTMVFVSAKFPEHE